MTDRIRDSFETWAKSEGFRDFRHHFNRYGSPVVRHMWAAWQAQSERITDMASALNRAQARNAELVNQCRDHDARRTAAMAQAASLAVEVERLNELLERLDNAESELGAERKRLDWALLNSATFYDWQGKNYLSYDTENPGDGTGFDVLETDNPRATIDELIAGEQK